MSYLFKSNNIYILLVLALFAYFLRGWALIGLPPELPESTTLLAKNMALWIHGLSPLGSGFLGITLVLAEAIWLNLILKKNEIIYKHTWLPAFCYVLCCSLLPRQFYLSVPMISSLFLIWALQLLFRLYKSDYANMDILNAGIVLGIGFLFQVEFLFLLPFFLIALSTLKVLRFRDIMISVIGFLLPFYVYFGISFLYNDHTEVWDELIRNLHFGNAYHDMFSNAGFYLSFILAFLVFLLGCFKLSRNFMKNMLKIRKFQSILIILLPFSLLMAFAGVRDFDNNLLWSAIPFSVYISYYTMGNDWGWWKELLLDLVIGLVVYNQWQTHLGK